MFAMPPIPTLTFNGSKRPMTVEEGQMKSHLHLYATITAQFFAIQLPTSQREKLRVHVKSSIPIIIDMPRLANIWALKMVQIC